MIAGPYVRLACQRHIDDLETGHKRGLVWDPAGVGGRAQAYFPAMLRLNGGQFEGKPFELLDFQAFKTGSIFGWLWKATGKRRFRTAYIEEGKGNGKSPWAAGIGLYGATQDGEARAEVYMAATTKDQSMVGFRDAVRMVVQSPRVRAKVVLTPADPERTDHIGHPTSGSIFAALAGNAPPSGPRPHFFLIDELHEHKDASVVNMASAGQKWREQPLVLMITNSGFDKKSVCGVKHDYTVKVLKGQIKDDEWFGYVCALDKGEDPFEDEACWIKANPGLGKIITKHYLRKQVREARGMPSMMSVVRRLNFCEWVGAENPWIDAALWLATEKQFAALEELALCDEVVGGLDLSGTQDLTALALTGRRNGRTIGRVEFWTPLDTLRERAARDLAAYDDWVAEGYMTATPGRMIDLAWVAQRIVDLQMLLPNFRRIAFDPHRIKYLEVELDRLNASVELVPHPQGYGKAADTEDETTGEEVVGLWMPRSIELLTKEIVDGRLDVETNPALTHNSASAVLVPDPKNNLIFTKRKSTGRIDGIVALAMAVGLLLDTKEPDQDLDDFINSPVIGY